MTNKWSIPALDAMKKHYDFVKSLKGVEAARKFRKKLFDNVEILKTYPRIGIEEKAFSTKTKNTGL